MDTSVILCIEGHKDTAQMPFQHNYWLAVEYYLSQIETDPVPDQILQAVRQEMAHWKEMWTKYNAATLWTIGHGMRGKAITNGRRDGAKPTRNKRETNNSNNDFQRSAHTMCDLSARV